MALRHSADLALVFENEKQKGNTNRAHRSCGAQAGGILTGSGPPRAGVRSLKKITGPQRPKPPLWREKKQNTSERRLPGLAGSRLSEGAHAPEAPLRCFETGREHKLNPL